MNAQSPTFDTTLTELQAIVASLGSKEAHGWWNCSFLSPAGLETLAYNFPRTAVSAAVTATAKAAALKHDQAAGAVGVFHLFRLPPALMERVHRHLVAESAGLAEMLPDQDRCIEALHQLAGDAATTDLGPGARNLGQFDSDDGALIPRLAAAYLAAFTEGYETFPYFTLA